MRANANSVVSLATAHPRVSPYTVDQIAMLKMPPPVDLTVTYVEGYYWIQNLKLGSVGVMLYTNGRWHRHDYETEEIGVVEGPLQPPTEQQRASQDAYFAADTQMERASFGDIKDPSWFDWVDGYYWVQWDDQEPEIALVVEDRWQSVSFVNGDNEWSDDFADADPDPMPVIYGPLIAPKVERTLHS